jgi:hypothetical protein
MPNRIAVLALCAAASAVLAPLAQAATCYVVFDRSDNVIYQSVKPPVDLSIKGAGERDALRRRGEFMEVFESQQCVERNIRGQRGKNGQASVDDIVAGVRSYQKVGRVGAMSGDDDSAQFAAPSTNAVRVPLPY